jgi:hypothetical protein
VVLHEVVEVLDIVVVARHQGFHPLGRGAGAERGGVRKVLINLYLVEESHARFVEIREGVSQILGLSSRQVHALRAQKPQL